jgi:hypothetical protein
MMLYQSALEPARGCSQKALADLQGDGMSEQLNSQRGLVSSYVDTPSCVPVRLLATGRLDGIELLSSSGSGPRHDVPSISGMPVLKPKPHAAAAQSTAQPLDAALERKVAGVRKTGNCQTRSPASRKPRRCRTRLPSTFVTMSC